IRALRDRRLESGFVECSREDVALLLIIGGEIPIVLVGNLKGASDAPLKRSRRANGEKIVHQADRTRHARVSDGITDPPAGDGKRLGEAADRDGDVAA